MEPKKARMAIAITVIVAVLIIAVCLCMLFEFNPFAGKEEESSTSEQNIEVNISANVPAPQNNASPSAADLKGCADDLYYPKPENYLSEYVAMITNSGVEDVDTVSLQYRPEKKEFSRHVIVELPNNTPVYALAQENGYTLVLVKEGLGGWIVTQELTPYN